MVGVYFTILNLIRKLILSNNYKTKRDIYYTNVNFYENQKNVDDAIEDIAATLKVSRNELHINASNKGIVGGPYSIIINKKSVPSSLCQFVPNLSMLNGFKTDCRFAILVEKETIFQQIQYNYEDLKKRFGKEFLFITVSIN